MPNYIDTNGFYSSTKGKLPQKVEKRIGLI